MKLRYLVLSLTCSVLLLVAGTAPLVSAATAAEPKRSATSSGSVQGYASDTVLQVGTIVQLDPKDNSKVLPATSSKAQQMYGVTVDPHNLSVTITDTSLKNEVFVATSGSYDVLVSNQAGAIKVGDYISLSSIDGLGMNANESNNTVFGRAAGPFDGKNNVLGSTTLKDKSGKAIKVSLGMIRVAINVQRNPNIKSTKANLPNSLQRAGEAVAEKPVSPVRIFLSVAITAMTVIVAIVMLYAGIRSSLIAIGRNPLSKKSIFRGLIEVVLASLVILIIGLFGVYLLLKL